MQATNDARLAEWLAEAAKMGREAGIAAASWVTDGNATREHYAKLAQMFDEGDPMLWDCLPAQPNLSGEWADGPTPNSLAADITGEDYAEVEGEVEGETIDAICEAWESACDEAFAHECERLVREAIA